jgi:hypothetical protein
VAKQRTDPDGRPLPSAFSGRAKKAMVVAVAIAIAAGLWLRWDAIHLGYHSDDHVQIGMLLGEFPAPRGPLDLFRLADVPRDGRAAMEQGYLPWWTDEGLKLALFRPLSSALFALDYRAFPNNPLYAHLHTLFWWVLAVVLCAGFLRSVLPPRVVAIAVFLFVIEEAHTVPVAWLANRNTLVATVFGLAGLWCHTRFRRDARLVPQMAEGFAFVLALGGGEYAVSLLAYVVAFEAFATGSMKERIRALLPAFSAFLIYVGVRAVFGYGVANSGYYISPAESPMRFAEAAFERVPVLIGDLILGVQAVYFAHGVPWVDNFESSRKWLSFLGALSIVLFVYATFMLDRASKHYRSLRWLCAGAVLSLFPSAGALPEDRTLVAAAVGASAVLAALLVNGYDAVRELLKTRVPTQPLLISLGLAAGVSYLHVYAAWNRSRDQIAWLGVTIGAQRRWALDADMMDPDIGKKHVVFISGADFTTNANLPWVRLVGGRPLPRAYWRLTGSGAPHEMFRVSANAIEVDSLTDWLDNTMVGSLYRSADAGFQAGDVVTLQGLKVEVLSTIGPHPRRMRFTFERSLDDPSYLFLHSTTAGMRRYRVPQVGKSQWMPSPEGPR